MIKYFSERFALFRKHGDEDAGWDLPAKEDVVIPPHGVAVVPTGIYLEIPKGLYGQIFARSSLASRGIIVTGGVIDPGYRGEVKVPIVNCSDVPIAFQAGDRIAQIVFLKIDQSEVQRVDSLAELDNSHRGAKGFGSTGKGGVR